MIFWKKRKWRDRTIIWRKHHGTGNIVEFDEILENLNNLKNKEQIELSKLDKTIRLVIPWGELLHHCNNEEWNYIIKILELPSDKH